MREFLNEPADTKMKVCRYFSIKKFESFISESSIWFSRANNFSDSLEGSFGLGNDDVTYNKLYAPPNTDLDPITIANLRSRARHFISALRFETYITCWHLNENESEEMWREYTDNKGVCVVTDYQAFKAKMKKIDRGIEVGFVQYIDHDINFIDEYDGIAPFFHKNQMQFEHERELRAVWSQPPFLPKRTGPYNLGEGAPDGKNVKVNLDFVQKVIVHPNASSQFLNDVGELCELAGFDKGIVKRSTLDK